MQINYRPRLIGLDMDGTLVDEHNRVPEENIAALHACRAAGIELAILTGRRPRTAGPLLDSIGLKLLVATNSGCLLWEYPAWKQLQRRMFPAEHLATLAELTAPHTINFYLDASVAGIEFIQLLRESTPEIDLHWQRYGQNTRQIHDVAELEGYTVSQAALPANGELVAELLGRVRATLDGQVLALAVRWPLLPTMALEVFHPMANKGAALAFFAERLGIAREATMAVGDDTNDIAMLKWAALGVAMPQAQAEVRSAASVVLDGNGARSLAPFLLQLASLPSAD